MATFPTLKTGAVAQYPAERSLQFETVVHEFVDGSEQRFRQTARGFRRWLIRLEQLDESELFRVEEFFLEQGGAAGVFSFTDPWDGTVYPACRFENDEMPLIFEGPGNAGTLLVIRENS